MKDSKSMQQVTQIPAGNYMGYIWMSNAKEPITYSLDNRFDGVSLEAGQNPFIIEAQLMDGKVSYSIKFVDGHYVALCYDLEVLSQEKDVEVTVHQYLANRIPGVEKVCFKEYWRPVPDPNCCGMKVLQPREFVFCGFIYKEE